MTLQTGSQYRADNAENMIDALASLHVRTVDTLAGYQTMVEKAEPQFRPVAEAFIALHAAHADALARKLTAFDRQPDSDGSFMGTINSAVVSFRALVDDIDTDVLGAIHSGEAYVLTAFDDVLDQKMTEADRSDLVKMRGELSALLAAHPEKG